jgi:hypothetical protein
MRLAETPYGGGSSVMDVFALATEALGEIEGLLKRDDSTDGLHFQLGTT